MERRSKNLSYSSYTTYVTCPKKWQLENEERLGPEYEPAHFLFGRVVDVGIEQLLLTKGKVSLALAKALKELDTIHDLKITFDDRDYDGELIQGEDRRDLIRRLQASGWTGDDPDQLASALLTKLVHKETLSENQTKALKLMVMETTYQKTKLMVESFKKNVWPLIEEVYAVQEKGKRGVLDIRARFKGYGDYIADVKTTISMRYYPQDAATHSVQMIGYGAEKAMYIVFDKNIKKNKQKICSSCGYDGSGASHRDCPAQVERLCSRDEVVKTVRCHGEWTLSIQPEVVPQIIVGDIPQSSRDLVESTYQDAEAAIDARMFPRNLTACDNQYGKPCPFKKLCWENDSTGLVKRERRNYGAGKPK